MSLIENDGETIRGVRGNLVAISSDPERDLLKDTAGNGRTALWRKREVNFE
jgi:hypothetical protein